MQLKARMKRTFFNIQISDLWLSIMTSAMKSLFSRKSFYGYESDIFLNCFCFFLAFFPRIRKINVLDM